MLGEFDDDAREAVGQDHRAPAEPKEGVVVTLFDVRDGQLDDLGRCEAIEEGECAGHAVNCPRPRARTSFESRLARSR